ncbi:hypothetical protein DRJ48_03605 [Candidatus Woesearchaeota archaeon]|nr:PD-(D/E)XK nuclease family protein [Candidatus Woesearchaeota archaeon]RLE42401.1 MAG: hypothetical protein DRJ48_03605 [Candidatus Woesearchaeota archaeon]
MNDLLRILEGMKVKSNGVSQKRKPINQTTFSDFSGDYSRTQSPSSINTYFECPRKYFYKYIKNLPAKPSIHRIRGKLLHSVLEDFFNLDPSKLTPSQFEFEIRIVLLEDLKRKWFGMIKEIEQLGLSKEEIRAYFEDSKRMVSNFVAHYTNKIKPLLTEHSLAEAFQLLTPKREVFLISKRYNVQGYLDAIYKGEKVRIIDYKTSSTDEFREEYKRQLAIYSLLYKENYGVLPDEVGLHFLLYGERVFPVTSELLTLGIKACKFVHSRTKSGNMADYPKGKRPLCKWHSGECDFYEICGGI